MRVTEHRPHQGREETSKDEIREQVWQSLRSVARPDARFHWDFSEFIPDFEGSATATERLTDLPVYRDARSVFVTPDNALTTLRAACVVDEKHLLVSTHGIARGFRLVPAGDVAADQAMYAATLDGLEHAGRVTGLQALQERGPIDLLVTGASAVSMQGVRFGKGHGYFDLEWAMFRELGLVDDATPVIAVGHDCQVLDVQLPASPFDTLVDYIITPTRVLQPQPAGDRPKGISWPDLEPGMLEKIPSLRELWELTGGASAEGRSSR